MSKEDYVRHERDCPVCGKSFIPAPMHIYKIKYGQFVCLYKCRCAYEKADKGKKYKKI